MLQFLDLVIQLLIPLVYQVFGSHQMLTESFNLLQLCLGDLTNLFLQRGGLFLHRGGPFLHRSGLFLQCSRLSL